MKVLITGSSTGFGYLAAKTLVHAGHDVFATMRGLESKNSAQAESLTKDASSAKGTLHLLELDVNSDDSDASAVAQALRLEGAIDAVINNAGYGCSGYAESLTVEQFQQLFDTNVFGVQRVNRAVLPHMRERGSGLLVHVSSAVGRMVFPFISAYLASKWALEGLAESYRYELAPTGVDSVIIEPGAFGTNFFQNMVPGADDERLGSYGELAQAPQAMFEGLGDVISGPAAPDPQLVADALLALIETPTGSRPVRTVVDPIMGAWPGAMNDAQADVQKALMSQFGMGHMLAPSASDRKADA